MLDLEGGGGGWGAGGERGAIKLEWFVSKVNWKGMRMEKSIIVDGNRALLSV